MSRYVCFDDFISYGDGSFVFKIAKYNSRNSVNDILYAYTDHNLNLISSCYSRNFHIGGICELYEDSDEQILKLTDCYRNILSFRLLDSNGIDMTIKKSNKLIYNYFIPFDVNGTNQTGINFKNSLEFAPYMNSSKMVIRAPINIKCLYNTFNEHNKRIMRLLLFKLSGFLVKDIANIIMVHLFEIWITDVSTFKMMRF